MPRTRFVPFLIAVWCLAGTAAAQVPASQRMVVVISLDGFPANALEDPKLPAPTLRRLMREGSSARRMTPINPTVTWPNHTAMVTGVHAPDHGLLVNGSLVRTGSWPPIKVDPSIDKEKMVHAPTLYDLAKSAGLTTAEIDWVAINRAPSITWHFPELATPEGKLEREMVEAGAISAGDIEQFSKSTILFRDEIWLQAASFLIRRHQPNLLLLHFLTLDSVQHRYGPKTLASMTAMAFLDRCVASVLDAIQSAGFTDRATVVIVSDHGFKAYQKQIRPAMALSGAGLSDSVFAIPEGGSAMIYVDKARKAELLPKVRRAFDGVEGIERIAGPADFAELGLPDPEKDPQMADLILYAKDGYAFAGGAKDNSGTGPLVGGSHGYLASDPDMDAIFIASGYGIRSGVVLDRIQNVDVAPTLAALLGIRLPRTDGTVLRGILR